MVTIAGPLEARPADGLAIDFVVVSDRAQLSEIARRVRDGRLRTNIGNVATLDDALPPQSDRAGRIDIIVPFDRLDQVEESESGGQWVFTVRMNAHPTRGVT